MSSRFLHGVAFVILVPAAFTLSLTRWTINNFGRLNVEQILFHLTVPLGGASDEIVISFVIGVVGTAAALLGVTLLVYLGQSMTRGYTTRLHLRFRQTAITVRLFPLKWVRPLFPLLTLLFLVASIAYANVSFGITRFIASTTETTDLYHHWFIDPNDVQLEFPSRKRNLIVIFVESMESTFQSRESGGGFAVNMIPELTELAMQHVNFSHTDRVGGAKQVPGTGWTMAGLVAHYAGVPLQIPIRANQMSRFATFLPGAVTLGDILQDAGYNQVFMIGSEKEFGGRDRFFTQHGNFTILDYTFFAEQQKIPAGYRVFWGFEDRRLYRFAQEELVRLSAEPEPFHFSMLTVDSHGPEGYLDEFCPQPHEAQFFNVLSCASRQLAQFLEWIEQQDFFHDTTIAVFGDHLFMDPDVLVGLDAGYDRRVYNLFINSVVEAENPKNRQFTMLDHFPTLLEAMGVQFAEPGLALGRSLWRDTPTIAEAIGMDRLKQELTKKSQIYDRLLYGN